MKSALVVEIVLNLHINIISYTFALTTHSLLPTSRFAFCGERKKQILKNNFYAFFCAPLRDNLCWFLSSSDVCVSVWRKKSWECRKMEHLLSAIMALFIFYFPLSPSSFPHDHHNVKNKLNEKKIFNP